MSEANLGDGANGLSEADREILRQAMAVDWCPPCAQGTTDVDGCHCSALFEAGVEKVAAIVREHTERAWDEAERVVTSRREAFLSSPNLDPAWIAGWHSAVDDVTNSVRAARQEQS